MRTGLFGPNPCRILVPIVLLTVMLPFSARAGRNANGALIVHTDDAVSYTFSDDYCLTTFLPASCEAAVTRTDKDEDTPAVIWLLAAFPDTSNPAVTAIYFGIGHNQPSGAFERWGNCAQIEITDAGWPQTGHGCAIAFGSSAHMERLFPFYWFSIRGPQGSYLETSVNPNGGYACVVDDGVIPVEDRVAAFGRVSWQANGFNTCPGGSIEGDDNANMQDAALLNIPAIYPKVIYGNAPKWTFLVTGVDLEAINSVFLTVDDARIQASSQTHQTGAASLWDVEYPPIHESANVALSIATNVDTLTESISVLRDRLPPGSEAVAGTYAQGELTLVVRPDVFTWSTTANHRDPLYQVRAIDQVPCQDATLSQLMQVLGISAIRRALPSYSEQDSIFRGPNPHPIPASLRRLYSIEFPAHQSIFALAEILKLCAGVETVSWSPRLVDQVNEDPISAPGAVYSLEWQVQSALEFPQSRQGVEANYAWRRGLGYGWRLMLVDTGTNIENGNIVEKQGILYSHPGLYNKLCAESDMALWIQDAAIHATKMGMIMTGRFPDEVGDYTNGYVGVAPEAELAYFKAGTSPVRFIQALSRAADMATPPFLTFLALPVAFNGPLSQQTEDDIDAVLAQMRADGVCSFAPAELRGDPYNDEVFCPYPGGSVWVEPVGGMPRFVGSTYVPPLPLRCPTAIDMGACCIEGQCEVLLAVDCALRKGRFLAAESTCGANTCMPQWCTGAGTGDPDVGEGWSVVRGPCGYFEHMPDLGPPWWRAEPGASGLSIATSMAAGSALLLNNCVGYPDVEACLSGLRDFCEGGRIQLAAPCGVSGLSDVREFHAVGGTAVDTLRWIVDDSTDLTGFIVVESPSCWGAWEDSTFFSIGEYSDDGVNYELIRTADYLRDYHYKLIVIGTEGTAVLEASCRPATGAAVTPWDPPDDVQLVAEQEHCELSWARSPLLALNMEYWVYRGATSALADCGPNEREHGGWLRGKVIDSSETCEGPGSGRACWYDDDLVPGVPYTYRVAVVKREWMPNGAILWMSELGAPITGYGVDPAGVDEHDRREGLAIKLGPVPSKVGQAVTLQVWTDRPGGALVDVCDASGRRMQRYCRRVNLRSGPQEIALWGAGSGRIVGPGVYFVRVQCEGPVEARERVVVLR